MTVIDPKTKGDCYAEGERGFMEWWNRVREVALAPLLRWLQGIGCLPDHLTLASFFCGLAFCPLYAFGEIGWALVALGIHVLLDGMDGPLARYLGRASASGSFSDTVVDQLIVTAVTLTLMALGVAGPLSGGLFLVFYTAVIAFAMVRNHLGVPYSWVLRPRFLLYAWIAVEAFWLPGSFDVVLGGFVGLLGIKVASGFGCIRSRLRG